VRENRDVETKSVKSGGAWQNISGSPKLFSGDVNYLRDVALVWPFAIFSIVAVASAYSPPNRQIALRSAALALAAILLAKEKLLLFFGVLGFCAIQSAIALVVHPLSWIVFAVGILTAGPFLLANRYWRNPKLAYQLPGEFGAVDMSLSFASICGSLALAYFVSPFK
jgi:cbb3-type cytochrome oxidase subunit 3